MGDPIPAESSYKLWYKSACQKRDIILISTNGNDSINNMQKTKLFYSKCENLMSVGLLFIKFNVRVNSRKLSHTKHRFILHNFMFAIHNTSQCSIIWVCHTKHLFMLHYFLFGMQNTSSCRIISCLAHNSGKSRVRYILVKLLHTPRLRCLGCLPASCTTGPVAMFHFAFIHKPWG